MNGMTAHVAIGWGHGGGIAPLRVMWLYEHNRPMWVLHHAHTPDLEKMLLAPEGSRTVAWVPSRPEHILEDGLLLIGLHHLRDAGLVHDASAVDGRLLFTPTGPENAVTSLEDVDEAGLAELRALTRDIDWPVKLVLSVFRHSSLHTQLSVLGEYPMDLEVCTPSYTRLRPWGAWANGQGPQTVEGSLKQPPGSGHHYNALNL